MKELLELLTKLTKLGCIKWIPFSTNPDNGSLTFKGEVNGTRYLVSPFSIRSESFGKVYISETLYHAIRDHIAHEKVEDIKNNFLVVLGANGGSIYKVM